jgi:type VI secretion system ImpH/TssG family protein
LFWNIFRMIEIKDRLLSQAEHFDFLQWLRLWLRMQVRMNAAPLLDRIDDCVDIQNAGRNGFPASDLDRGEQGPGGKARLFVNFMGLSGSASPLPSYFLDGLERGRETHAVVKPFLDIFDRRVYAVYASALLRRRPGLRAELDGMDSLQERLADFCGHSKAAECARALSGWECLAPHQRSKVGLERYLAKNLGLPCVSVFDRDSEWVACDNWVLGDCRMDGSAALGGHVSVAGARVRISLGSVGVNDYLRLCTHAEAFFRRIESLLADHLNGALPWRVSLEMETVEGECRLDVDAPPTLGRYAWLGDCNVEKQRLVFESA